MTSVERPKVLSIDQLVERVRREYAALPGLRLTEAQVRRIWGLDSSSSDRVLRRLIDADFLRVTPGGQYVRAEWQPLPHHGSNRLGVAS
jgi:hypothetical protein